MLPDAEELVVAWLNSDGVLPDGVSAYGDKPSNQNTFVLVDRTGGAREAMVLDRAEMLIECYDKESRVTAKNMANQIADKITELEFVSDDITRARINSVVNLDDTLGGFHRYQVYVDVNHRRRI